jgi:hypothetical protein
MYRPSFKPAPVVILPKDGNQDTGTLPLPEITFEERLKAGTGKRYFTYHRSNKTILEVNTQTYQALKAKFSKYDYMVYKIAAIKWDTTLPAGDSMEGGYRLPGANTRNLQEVAKVEKDIPGLKDYLITKGELFL